jgi:putative N6-adenine-specific DNA methylase
MPLFPRPAFAVAPPGLENVLAGELARLGIPSAPRAGGLEWEGGWEELIQAHLHLRTASRILVRIGRFRARALGELRRKAERLGWEGLLPAAAPVRIRAAAGRSRIYHEGAVEERFLEILQRRGHPPASADEGRVSTVHVRIHRDEVTVSLDASGEHLHRRGYRLDPGPAPLRENVAAGALLAAGWAAEAGLLDPFAGSGTIPIEAALLAMRIPPGLAGAERALRTFAFREWPGVPHERLEEDVERARAGILARPPAPLVASDRDPRAVERIRENAARAGVLEHIRVEAAPLSRAPDPDPGAWVVTNPPYGARLGARKRLRPLYRALGRRMREGWSGRRLVLFSADRVLEGSTGLELREVFRTRSGGIPVRLLVTPDPPGAG